MAARSNPSPFRSARSLVLGAAALAVTGGVLHAFVTQTPPSYWPVGNVEWKVHIVPDGGNIPNPPLTDGSATWDDAFQVVVDAWNAVLPDNVLTLSIVKNSGVVPGSGDGVNNVGFSSTVYGNAWGGSTLGISITTSTGNKRIENDILFNSTRTWNAYTGNLQGNLSDFRRVALHEMGHSLGLLHPDDFGQVVNAIMNSTVSNIDALRQDDIDGVLSLYATIRSITISKQPQSFTTPVGTQAAFDVEVTGSEDITYSWERSTNGGASFSPLGVNGDNFFFPSVSAGQNGHQFRVVITNPAGTVTSDAAILTVTASAEAPVFTTQPTSVNANPGDDVTFTVVVTGSPTPTLQWQYSNNGGTSFQNVVNDEDTSGATTATLSVNDAQADINGYLIRCVATNTEAVVNSTTVTLNVSAGSPPSAPAAQSGSISAYNAFGASWQASAGATGYRLDVATDAAFTNFVSGYQDRDVGNVTSFNVTGLTGGTYYYRVRATSAGGTSTSSGTISIIVGGRLVNLSTRGQTSTGANTMIAGLVVGGGQPKQLLIRAVGPTLAAPPFGLQGTVANPRLRLQKLVNGAVESETVHDDWNQNDAALVSATTAVGAFDLLPGSLDASVLVTLDPGSYTAQVETVTGAAGIAIVEVYETNDTGRLVNISTRGFVGVGEAIIIPGTVTSGGPKRLLVRAIGETIGLPPFGVPGVLEDPVLDVFPTTPQGAPALFTNDDWQSNANAAEIATVTDAVGGFALNAGSKDAALLIVLDQGGYTFVVHGKNGATGVVIVEVYEVP